MKIIPRDKLVNYNDYDKESVISIKSGESVLVETVAPYEKPNITGPIHIEGVLPGDSIAITIKNIEFTGDGVMFFGHNKNEPWSGVLRNQSKNPIEKTIKLVGNKLEFTKDIILETRPMVGWIAILDANTKNDTGDHGGNMDTKELGIGTTLVLHDTSGIGKIILGDVHALMGDGEICGTGVEIPANVEIQIDIIHNTRNHRPLLITSDYIITIATRDTHEKAYTQCIADMVAYVQQEHSLSFEEANGFVSAVCDLRVSTVVSRLCTYKILLPIQYCKNRKDLII